MNQEKDAASIYCENGKDIKVFTENDIFNKIGLTHLNMKELRDFIKPELLKTVASILEVELESQGSPK